MLAIFSKTKVTVPASDAETSENWHLVILRM